jgi:hypothetical protein
MRCTRAGLPGQHRFRQLEHVVTRHVEHGGFDLRLGQFARRVQQCQLLDLLVRGQQVALHAVGKKLQGALPLLARHHALALGGQALGNPLRELRRARWGRSGWRRRSPRARQTMRRCLVVLSRRGSITSVSVLSLPRADSANCCSATLPSLPGLPEGMRISTICLSANRLKLPPAASTALQSKWAPATV